MRSVAWWICVLLLALAAVMGALSREGPSHSSIPTSHNPGAAGLKALFTYFAQSGRQVRALDAAWSDDALGSGTLILAEPSAREVSKDELKTLERFLERKGRLVYLAPTAHAQSRLEEWLGLDRRRDPLLPSSALFKNRSDPGSALAQVSPLTALSRARQLSVATPHGLAADDAENGLVTVAAVDGVPVALYRLAFKGDIWVFANASLAQNGHLAAADNLAMWEALATQEPIVFDELHHQAERNSPLPAGVLYVGLQLLAMGALFALAAGSRFGPPRPGLATGGRSSVEYAASLGALARGAHLEGELLQSGHRRLRALLQTRLGVAPQLAESEVTRVLEEQLPQLSQRYAAWVERLFHLSSRVTPATYAAMTRELAELERGLDR